MSALSKTDPQLAKLISEETKRQSNTLMMIASENMVSKAVEEAVGSCLENKYSEGYPYRRYYQGQQYVDQIETLAIERAKKVFGVEHVNVQPYSGSPANTAVFFALLKPGDTLMGLDLANGGHLTHGSKVSISGTYFHAVTYSLGADEKMDYDAIEKLALESKPKIIIAGITAYSLKLNWKRFGEIADKVGAYLLADMSHVSGLVAAGVYPSPVPFVHLVSTTTHKTLRGARGAMIMVTKKGLLKDPDLAKKIDKAVFPGLQGGPHINNIAGIAVALKEATSPKFKLYAQQIIKNAQELASVLMKQGIHLVAEGTETHLILVDLSDKDVSGNLIAEAFEAANIVLNRNSIPFDKKPPFYPSGIRMGTAGITSRGLKEPEMQKIGTWMKEIIEDIRSIKEQMKIDFEQEKKSDIRKKIIQKSTKVKEVKKAVIALCKEFPNKPVYI